MLEYYLLSRLCSSLAETLHSKGRNPSGYKVLFVVLWIGSEIMGFAFGFLLGLLILDDGDLAWVFAVLGALLGAALAAGSVFLFVHLLPPLEGAYAVDGDDAYGPGWRRSDRDRLRRHEEAGGKTDHPTSDDAAVTDRPESLPRRRRDDRLIE
jgi:hypothetical protein